MKNKLAKYMQEFVDEIIYEGRGKYTVIIKDKYAYETKIFTAASIAEVKEKLRTIINKLL